MKTIDINGTSLSACVDEAQVERVLLPKNGLPVAMNYGLQGLDEEQLQLCRQSAFWELIQERCGQPTVSREQLEEALTATQT
ncbi:MAG: hypothetical protein AB7U20_05435 [Planctomycetaceae bacterium]